MRTPIAQVRGLGSAKKGTGEFVMQRVTSVALVILVAFFVWLIVVLNGEPYERVIAVISTPPVALFLITAILVIIVHMRLGMQVVIEDYVHHVLVKFTLLVANWLFSWAVGLSAAYAVLVIAFGG